MNEAFDTFFKKAPVLMSVLMEHYGLSDEQAAGIAGNLGHESDGFTELHEIGQRPGRGGYGWGQWTASRREDFLSWCEQNHLDWHSDGANTGFLLHELNSAYRDTIIRVKQAATAREAATAFERFYERAGVVNMKSRWAWADRALAAYKAAGAATKLLPFSPVPPGAED